MATDRIPKIRQAIHDILMSTGKYATGTPYYRRAIGPCPAFMVACDGFVSNRPERAAGANDAVTTHRLQVEVYSLCGSSEEDNQNRFDELVALSVEALQNNHRLNDTCLRARPVTGQADWWKEGNNLYWQMIMFIEADVANW